MLDPSKIHSQILLWDDIPQTKLQNALVLSKPLERITYQRQLKLFSRNGAKMLQMNKKSSRSFPKANELGLFLPPVFL